jgi:hypothetical protein
MGIAFDAAVAVDNYSLVGRRLEVAGVPFDGIFNVTGGGVTIEGQTYQRGAAGQILSVSDGIETPQDITLEMTAGSWTVLRQLLEAQALAIGVSGDMAYRFAPFTIVHQWIAAAPSVDAYTETSIVKVASRVPEMPIGGENAKITIACKQQSIPQET